ncbi:MAG TPA: serine/threonine-protein kinase [Polyangiaceae bacterium]|jgi:serine/threonine-protein kinase
MTMANEGNSAGMANVDVTVGDADPLSQLRVGTVVEGKYRVEQVLGRGGMGVVVAATHVDLNEKVALKFLHVKESDSENPEDFQARFALEARVCAKLRNDHIARVRDVAMWKGKVPFMVMEYLEGTDLRRVVRAEKKLSVAKAAEYVIQICEGLAEAHAQGIVHRDLKPANMFITKRHDGAELVKVLDFGISKWSSGNETGELTKTGIMLGSPKYMSPEQLNGSSVDARSDVWAIGAIFYEMLTGRPPYDFPQVTRTFVAIASGSPPPPPSTLEPSIPAEIDAVILRCLTHDRDQRMPNVAELAGSLLEALESPFASQVRAQLGLALEPNSPSAREAVARLSVSTGSFSGRLSTSSATPKPATLEPSVAEEVAAMNRPRKRWAFASATAVVAMVLTIGGARAASATGTLLTETAASLTKVVMQKNFAAEAPTSLAAPPAGDESAATPARPAARVAMVARSARTQAPARAAAPASEAAAPSPAAPAPAPPASEAAPAKPANPLGDRQ